MHLNGLPASQPAALALTNANGVPALLQDDSGAYNALLAVKTPNNKYNLKNNNNNNNNMNNNNNKKNFYYTTTTPPPLTTTTTITTNLHFLQQQQQQNSNQIDNVAAAAAVAAAGLIDPATMVVSLSNTAGNNNNNIVSNVANGNILKQQQQQTHAAAMLAAVNGAQPAALYGGNNKDAAINGNGNGNSSSSGRSTPASAVAANGGQTAASIANNNNISSNGAALTTTTGAGAAAAANIKIENNVIKASNGNGNGIGDGDSTAGKLFVGGLSWQTTPEKLKEYFNVFGTVTDVLIMKDMVTQRSRGFGFITFQEAATVDKVLKVPIHTLDGKKIDPKHATPKNRPQQSSKTKKIFVGGITQETTREEVQAYFSAFGPVEDTVLLMDTQTKRHRGFGFVTFANEKSVDQVCDIHFHEIKGKRVECKHAEPKDNATSVANNAAAQIYQKQRLLLNPYGIPINAAAAAAGLPTLTGQQTSILGARPTAGGAVTAAGLNSLLPGPLPQALLQAGPGTPNSMGPPQHAAAAAAAALFAQQPNGALTFANNPAGLAGAAASNPFGKMVSFPQAALHSLRFSPYGLPNANAIFQAQLQSQQNAAAVAAVQQQQQQQAVAQQQQQQRQQQQQQHHQGQQQAQNGQAGAAQSHQTAAAALGALTGAGAPGGVAHSLAAAQQAFAAGNHALGTLNVGAGTPTGLPAYPGYAFDLCAMPNIDWSQYLQ